MKIGKNIEKAKRFLGKNWAVSYLHRLFLLGLLLAFLLVYKIPGFEVQMKIPMGLFVSILTLLYFALICGLVYILNRFFSFLFTKASIELVLILLNIYLLEDLLSITDSLGPESNLWKYGLIFLLLLSLSTFAHFSKRLLMFGGKKIFDYLGILVSVCGLAILGFYFFSEGFDNAPKQEVQEKFFNRPYSSKYKVEQIEYGPYQELDFGAVNLRGRTYVSKWNGKLRRYLLGHGLSDIIYKGRIFLPQGKENVPFMVFVHGNHNMLEDNMGGYDYLGRFLASQGYGFVSIDQSVFNGYMGKGTGNENDARALFLLYHTEKLLEESQKEGSPLYGRLQKEDIILGGHSRGGEAAAIAAYFNSLDYLPDEGSVENKEPISIKGVLAVAPTYGQYLPSEHPVDLKDISYLLIHGSHDQDVSDVQGMDQYRYTDFTKTQGNFKAQVLVPRANHGQFNENWGRRDKSLPSGFLLNTKDLLEKEDQEKILQVYALNFLEVIEEKKDSKVFMDIKGLKEHLPLDNYFTRYENDQVHIFADFEEDSRLETATDERVKINGENLSSWREEAFISSGNEKAREHVVTGMFYSTGGLEIDFPSKYIKNKEGIKFDVAFSHETSKVFLEIEDKRGNKALLSSEGRKEIFGPEKVGLVKWHHLARDWEEKNSLQSIYFSFEDFQKNNPKLDGNQIYKLRIYSDPGTSLYLDNIGLYSFLKSD